MARLPLLEELQALLLHRLQLEDNNANCEMELEKLARNFEEVRKKWLHAEETLKTYKELLVKSDVAKAALEVKLKHARNQLDLEMKKRYKIEADFHYLQRQMQLMCDILIQDNTSAGYLNDEQKSLLATFERKGSNATLQRTTKRLSVIDESSLLSHSDISYDRTYEILDTDTAENKALKSRPRAKRRSSMGPAAMARQSCSRSAELLESTVEVAEEVGNVVKASMKTPQSRGPIPMMEGTTQGSLENPDAPMQDADPEAADQTSVWSPCDNTLVETPTAPEVPVAPSREQISVKHVFISKTVIWTETCPPCGKRTRFGKMAVKCRNCHVVVHPECQQKFISGCPATGIATGKRASRDSLEGFAPRTRPRVAQPIKDCVAEIERRGLQEKGLYRIPGGERQVKDLCEQVFQRKQPLQLSKVHNIHVVGGLLKDFLRRLKEPLLTFKLHPTFMEAAELQDEERTSAIFCRALSELPQVNKDTLAFIMLHLHTVMKSPLCQMDRKNLTRVFGPTIVGHGMAEPSPSTILRDANTQPKVMSRLLSIPEDYWTRVLQNDHSPSTFSSSSRLFQPLTSPENRSNVNEMRTTLSTREARPMKKFFTSPTASER
ncbi:rac GTPase-activating protein 1-like [Salarias fasciatus]|uniref:rac GTPase-activating protein 1-like n=1 Tax=Salarias fasciatus TaxID=181472 RepID=UPI001176A816|nr:rac GTPase-activating protein 1-like [Salarias fasciatus]